MSKARHIQADSYKINCTQPGNIYILESSPNKVFLRSESEPASSLNDIGTPKNDQPLKVRNSSVPSIQTEYDVDGGEQNEDGM